MTKNIHDAFLFGTEIVSLISFSGGSRSEAATYPTDPPPTSEILDLPLNHRVNLIFSRNRKISHGFSRFPTS